jgi:O-acetyl-ADP-ribose deacetylase (regulator of RNase III)
MTIRYTIGDATDPQGDGQKIIAHVCNDEGKWGSGFVVALSKRNPVPENCYRLWHRKAVYLGTPFELGEVQVVNFGEGVWVANMIAQRGVRHSVDAPRAVRYGALRSALIKLADYSHLGLGVPSVHMPRIGCGLGGGTWDEIEPIIQDTLVSRGIDVTVYDLESTTR